MPRITISAWTDKVCDDYGEENVFLNPSEKFVSLEDFNRWKNDYKTFDMPNEEYDVGGRPGLKYIQCGEGWCMQSFALFN